MLLIVPSETEEVRWIEREPHSSLLAILEGSQTFPRPSTRAKLCPLVRFAQRNRETPGSIAHTPAELETPKIINNLL